MVCSTEVYQWFKELSPFNRIDFLCSIMQLCLPNELRFIGTLLDDMNNKDYANLREVEDRSNSPNEFRQYPIMPFTEEGVRKLCLSLSLLKSTNQKVGQIIYEILKIHFNYANESVKLKDKFSNEVLLLYALASYHPAFTFENRFKIGKQFKILQSIYEDSSEEYSNNNNNNSCYKDNKNSFLNIDIKSVTIEHFDADIILEISTDNSQNSNIERVTKFSKIIELFKESKHFRSDLFSTLHLEIIDISKNGNFNVNNIRSICQKIIKFLNSNSDENSQFIKKFFLQLPVYKKKSHSSQIEMTNSNSRGDFCVNTDDISLKSNFKFFNENDSTNTSYFEGLKNETLIKDDFDKNIKLNNSEKSEIIWKEKMYSDVNKDFSSQHVTETIYLHDSVKIQETFESIPSEMSDIIINSDGSHFQDVNPIRVHYFLPPYSYIPAMKSSSSSSSSSQFVLYSNNNNSNNNNSFEQVCPGNNNSNKITCPLIPEQLILAQYPNVLGAFNSRVNSLVPMFCSANQSTMNLIPINEMHYEHFYPLHRMYSVTAATNIKPSPSPAVAAINKLSSSSSSTPPRLQSNYHKSSQYSTNFSGS